MAAERHGKVLFRPHSGLILCIVKIGETGSSDCGCRSNSLPLLPKQAQILFEEKV